MRSSLELVTADLRPRHGSLDVPQIAGRQSPYSYYFTSNMETTMPKSIAEGAALIIAEAALAISEGKLGRSPLRAAHAEPAADALAMPPTNDATTQTKM
jgi:hypothetical protein